MVFFISKITHGGGHHGYRPEVQIEVGVHFMLTGEDECMCVRACVCVCVCMRVFVCVCVEPLMWKRPLVGSRPVHQ